MLGWTLSAVIIASLFVIGFGALMAPSRSAAMYGIVLDDSRALAFIRAMGVRDVVIGGLLAVIAAQGRPGLLGWALCLTAVTALVDYVIVAGDRRSAGSGTLAQPMAPVLHALGAVGLVVAGGLLLAG